MPDLDERFRSLSRTRAPDLWSEIDGREPRAALRPPVRPRFVAAVAAFIVAAAGFAGAALVLGRVGPTDAGAVTNGRIAFAAPDGETWQVYSVESDGTGLARLTQVEAPFVVSEPAWSPDGSRLAYVVRESDTDRSDIWIMHADGSDAHPITNGPGSPWGPAWSPDGSRIAFTHGNDIYVVAADGTNRTNLTNDPGHPTGAFDPAWSPDGEYLAFVGREADDDLYLMRSDGSDVRTLFGGAGAQREPAWSPDGSEIAFADHTNATESEAGEITLIDPTGTVVGRLSDLPPVAQAPAWSPDGQLIAFMAYVEGAEREAIYVMNADGTEVREIPGLPANASWPAWQTILVKPEPEPTSTPSPFPPPPKANGSIYYRVGGEDGPSRIEAVEPDGSGRRVVLDGDSANIAHIAWSPDGTRIAYRNPIASERGIYVANPNGTDAVRLTDGVNDGWPSWSPEGTQIAFSSTRHDPSVEPCSSSGDTDLVCPTDIYVMDSDGSRVTHLMTGPGPEYQPAWSPDGTTIAFTKTFETWIGTAIYVMNSDGTEIRRVSSQEGGSDSSPRWSPDGSQIVFTGFRYEDTGIWIVAADGSNERRILGEGWYSVWNPVWSPDGTLIAFVGSPDGGEAALDKELYVMRPDGTGVTQLADAPGSGVTGEVAWQPITIASEGPAPSESPPSAGAPLDPRVTATIQVGAFPRAVAVGEGAVWAAVSTGEPDGSLIVKIDPTTNEIVETVPTRVASDIAVGDEALWTTSWEGDEGVLLRIDPATLDVVAAIQVGRILGNVAYGFGDVWVTRSTSGDPSADELVRIDPATNQVVARVRVEGGEARDVVVGEGSVWVYGHSRHTGDVWEASSLWRIDPATNEVVATVLEHAGFLGAGAFLPDNVAVGGGWVWAADDGGRGVRIDPATGAFTTFEPEGGFAWPYATYEGHVFFGLGTVRILDMETLEVVGSIALDSQVADAALDPATGTLWIANYEGSVTRVDLH